MILLELNRRVIWDGAPFRGGRTITCGPFVRESATFTRHFDKKRHFFAKNLNQRMVRGWGTSSLNRGTAYAGSHRKPTHTANTQKRQNNFVEMKLSLTSFSLTMPFCENPFQNQRDQKIFKNCFEGLRF